MNYKRINPAVAAMAARVSTQVDTRKELDEMFTRDERLRMAYVPVVVTETIWQYIDKVLGYCVAERLEVFKKLTRTVKQMRADYYDYLKKSIDGDHLAVANICAQDFQKTFATDMAVMWFTINSELKKHYPEAPHLSMRTDALCAMLLIRLVKQFCRRTAIEIERRTGCIADILNPRLRHLDEIMGAYVGDTEIDRTELVRRCEVILDRAMQTIKYVETK